MTAIERNNQIRYGYVPYHEYPQRNQNDDDYNDDYKEWFIKTNPTRIWLYKGKEIPYEEYLAKTRTPWVWYKEQKIPAEEKISTGGYYINYEVGYCPCPSLCSVITTVALLATGLFAWGIYQGSKDANGNFSAAIYERQCESLGKAFYDGMNVASLMIGFAFFAVILGTQPMYPQHRCLPNKD